MTRDMELVRNLLLALERSEGPDFTDVDGLLEGCDAQAVVYHWTIMHEAGLIEGTGGSTSSGVYFIPDRLTWYGHEFLDQARDDTVWQKAKSRLGERFAGVPFGVISAVLIDVVKDSLGVGHQ